MQADQVIGTIQDHLILFYRRTIGCINYLLANRPCYQLERMARFCQLLEEFIPTFLYCLGQLGFDTNRQITVEFGLTCNPTLNLYYWGQLMNEINLFLHSLTLAGEERQLAEILTLISNEVIVNYRIYSNLYNGPTYTYPANTTPPQIINNLQW